MRPKKVETAGGTNANMGVHSSLQQSSENSGFNEGEILSLLNKRFDAVNQLINDSSIPSDKKPVIIETVKKPVSPWKTGNFDSKPEWGKSNDSKMANGKSFNQELKSQLENLKTLK